MKDPFGSDESALLAPSAMGAREASRRAVAARAADTAELALLLDILGLMPETSRPHQLLGPECPC
ncbi:hypothetical protein [Streptomyces sp. NPDC096339]|uniref:hypothetical protein n=1 Tax=Streptomyces sp. NPDC096339 TaxID=3366086 RepID=UPI00382D0B3F